MADSYALHAYCVQPKDQVEAVRQRELRQVLVPCPLCGAKSVREEFESIANGEAVRKAIIRCPNGRGKNRTCAVTIETIGTREIEVMPTFSKIEKQRYKAATRKHDLSDKAFAQRIGIPYGTLTGALAGSPMAKERLALVMREVELLEQAPAAAAAEANPVLPPIFDPEPAPAAPPEAEKTEAPAVQPEEDLHEFCRRQLVESPNYCPECQGILCSEDCPARRRRTEERRVLEAPEESAVSPEESLVQKNEAPLDRIIRLGTFIVDRFQGRAPLEGEDAIGCAIRLLGEYAAIDERSNVEEIRHHVGVKLRLERLIGMVESLSSEGRVPAEVVDAPRASEDELHPVEVAIRALRQIPAEHRDKVLAAAAARDQVEKLEADLRQAVAVA